MCIIYKVNDNVFNFSSCSVLKRPLTQTVAEVSLSQYCRKRRKNREYIIINLLNKDMVNTMYYESTEPIT
jgi:hypothetical protein